MADFCGFCEEELGDQPITELLCNHFFHTTCILNMFTMHPQNHHLNCVTCQQPFFTVQAQPVEQRQEEQEDDEIEEEDLTYLVREASERIRVTNLYDTDPKVRDLIKKYKAAYREVGKPKTVFTKLLTRKREALSTFTEPLFRQLRERHREVKEDVFNSLEYKTFRQKDAAVMRYYNKLQSTYNITWRSFQFLANKRGCRGLRRPNYFNPYRMRRKIRIRCYFM